MRVGETVGGKGESLATNAFLKDEEGRTCKAKQDCESAASRRRAYMDVLAACLVYPYPSP